MWQIMMQSVTLTRNVTIFQNVATFDGDVTTSTTRNVTTQAVAVLVLKYKAGNLDTH